MTGYAAIAEETLELARRSNDPGALCVAHMMFNNLNMYTGKFAAMERSVAEAARHYRADEHQGSFQLSGLDIGVHIPLGLTQALSLRGNHAEAKGYLHDALRLAEAQPQIGTLCWALYWLSFCCLIQRDFECVGAFADRAVALAKEHGIGIWATAGELSQAAAVVVADPGRAEALIGVGLTRLESFESRCYFHPTYLCFQGEALLRLGRVAEARGAIDRALAMTASTGLAWWDAELHRTRAAVIRAEGGGEAAVRDALSRAIAIAEQQGSETFRIRAAADIAAFDAPSSG
jgi:tetratricopeptide (TPR) repeat protein